MYFVRAIFKVAFPISVVVLVGIPHAHAWTSAAPMCALEVPRATVPAQVQIPDPPPAAEDEECGPLTQPPPTVEELTIPAARCTLQRVHALSQAGRAADALPHLSVLEEAFPRIADRLALLRGDLLVEAGQAREACAAFRVAVDSPDSTVRMHGRVGAVRCLIAAHDPRAQRELDDLSRRYPRLPQELPLRFELGREHERSADPETAIRVYQQIDLNDPGSASAGLARERLAALAADGLPVRPYTLQEKVDRADRLLSSGPLADARDYITALHDHEPLSGDRRARIALMLARIARVEGRFEDAARYMRQGRGASTDDPEDVARRARRQHDMEEAADQASEESAQRRINAIRRGKPYLAMDVQQLVRVLEIAAQASLRDTVDQCLAALIRKQVPGGVRFDAAIVASGVGSDRLVAGLLQGAAENPRGSLAIRYHYARALQRMGHNSDAERHYLRIVAADRSPERYYAMWSQQRLWEVREAMIGAGETPRGDDEQAAIMDEASAEAELVGPEPVDEAIEEEDGPALAVSPRGVLYASLSALEPRPTPAPEVDDLALAEMLTPVIDEHGESYPWLGRAQDLLRLGEHEGASDELHEAFVAWREARGTPMLRTGLEAVCRGTERARTRVDRDVRRERIRLGDGDRAKIAQVAEALGDVGTAAALTGWSMVRDRPRAYEHLVRRAAQRHSVDPNLLLAVMRVESVYQPRIVSYAGAIGLMQIMPRTGKNIADSLGHRNFTTADLLDPETNIDFAAWYLASLIERFDGRLPLAIASYNGGPHNVRRWMHAHSPDMPLDAFLERIPFEQTHRYVRRVLTHYAAYREQEDLPMTRLPDALPPLRADEVAF